MALFPMVTGGGTALGFTLFHRQYGEAAYNSVRYDVSNDTLDTHRLGIQTFDDYPEVKTYMPSSSPFPVTVTFKMAGYYRIQTSKTSTPSWVYKTANSTETIGTGDDYVFLFYYSDLKQH